MTKSNAGYSLIELLLVVAIIGTLADMAMHSWNKYYKPKIATTHMKTIAAQIYRARDVAEKTTMQITGIACPDCLCRYGTWETDMCKERMDKAYKALGYAEAPKTPWGGYYYLDNNEGESFWINNYGDQCYGDTLSYYDRDNDKVVTMVLRSQQCKGAVDVFGGSILDEDGESPLYSLPTEMYREVPVE